MANIIIPREVARELPTIIKCVYCPKFAVVIPAVVMPIKNWPHPAYLLVKDPETAVVRGLCDIHRYVFSLEKFTDYYGSWYDMLRAHVESYRKLKPVVRLETRPAKDPEAARLGWVENVEVDTGLKQVVEAGYKPAEKEDCKLVFWPVTQDKPKGRSLW